MLKRFIFYYKPHKWLFAADMTASLLISLTGMIYPIVTKKMLGTYIPQKMYSAILIAGCIVFGIYILRMLLQFFVQYYGHIIGVRMQAQMRKDLFAHLEDLPFSFYDENETGKIMSRLTHDLFEISELAHHGPENILISSIMVVLSFSYLCSINFYLTLIVFSIVPVMVTVSIYFRKRMRKAFMARRAADAQINASVESSITGIRVTKAYTNADKEIEKFGESTEKFVQASNMAHKAMARFFSSTGFINDVFNVIILIAGGLFLYAGKISFADYSTFIVSINLFLSPVNTLINFTEQFQNGATGFRRFVELMDESPEFERKNAEDAGKISGEIEFRDVSFTYNTEKPVLDHINLKIEKGKKLALVGPSGGGKTTLCHLIPNFYQLQDGDGTVLLDGKDVRDLTLESVRRNIGIVQQDVFLFGGTIKENILYGRLDATDEEVIDAAKKANIHDFVMGLEHGYDTEIGERGVKLSGGQKQRLSIARVFLKDPAVLILDEATSALDNTTELLIQEALDDLCEGRTSIVVAHRLSTVRNADEIAVILNGRVLEQGTHDQLMVKGGKYKELYELQFKKT